MNNDDFEEEDILEEEDVSDELEGYLQEISEITERCEEVGINIQEDEGGILGINYDLYFPESDAERRVTLWDLDDAQNLNNVKFENFRFIEGYQSFCSYESGWIVSSIIPIVPVNQSHFLFQLQGKDTRPKELLRLISENPEVDKLEGLRVQVADSVDTKKKLYISTLNPVERIMVGYGAHDRLVLRLTGLNIPTHKKAQQILETVADTICLQIEAETGIAFALERSRKSITGYIEKYRKNPDGLSYIYPSIEYNRDPMSFYWYGISSYQMPLMQFLAFYQSIEYFYPVYSEHDMKRSIQGILKSPGFRVDRDSDIAKLLGSIRSGSGRGFGSELNQLKATLKECIDPAELREFLKANDGADKVFSSKKQTKNHSLNLDAKAIDVVSEVAVRVYNIRCRIVHTKVSEDDVDSSPLLPYTKEELHLKADIALVKFLALKVLSHSAATMH